MFMNYLDWTYDHWDTIRKGFVWALIIQLAAVLMMPVETYMELAEIGDILVALEAIAYAIFDVSHFMVVRIEERTNGKRIDD